MRTATALLVTALWTLLWGAPARAQRVSGQLEEAYYAWDQGDYAIALEAYLAVLNGIDGDRLKDEIALLTGELFEVTELAADGSDVRVGADGRYGTYMVGGVEEPTIAIFELGETPAVVSTFPGRSPTLSADGQVAFYRVGHTPELESAVAEVARALQEADRAARARARAAVRWSEALNTTLWIRDIETGEERQVALNGVFPVGMDFSPDGRTLFFTGGRLRGDRSNHVYAVQTDIIQMDSVQTDEPPTDELQADVPRAALLVSRSVLAGEGFKVSPRVVSGGRYLLYVRPSRNPLPARPDGPSDSSDGAAGFARVDLQAGEVLDIEGTGPAVSASGDRLAFITERGERWRIEVVTFNPGEGVERGSEPSVTLVIESSDPIENVALSPEGGLVAYQKRLHDNWEIFAATTDGSREERRISNEIQHDVFPRFLDGEHILAAKGEARHRRSFVYDLRDGSAMKLFHNNTVRTIAPEYEWAGGVGGSQVVIVSERDGDTVSPERGVYVVDLGRRVTKAAVRERLQRSLAAERQLIVKGERVFAPLRSQIEGVTERVSVARIFQYETDLFAFGSKHITEPGNAQAIEYLTTTLKSFGYSPELQSFEPQRGASSANVLVRIEGTTDSDLTCVVSSHFDSSRRGPGADDNTSGTAALLEAARVLAGSSFPLSIELAFFTGEESGLLGSREYVRRAVESDKRIVCALNNDMVGWANDHKLDNTIRYSNPGIRDIQHGAAMIFSDLITYDALYYKSTDAHAYYEVYGDIVGGIGSYPVLGNPNYHQATDRLTTINHRLVAEVSKTTIASIMLLASTPPRLSGLSLRRTRVSTQLTWDASEMSGVLDYGLRYTATDGSSVEETRTFFIGEAPRARLDDVLPGSRIGVRAISQAGLEGWDWAWATVPPEPSR